MFDEYGPRCPVIDADRPFQRCLLHENLRASSGSILEVPVRTKTGNGCFKFHGGTSSITLHPIQGDRAAPQCKIDRALNKVILQLDADQRNLLASIGTDDRPIETGNKQVGNKRHAARPCRRC